MIRSTRRVGALVAAVSLTLLAAACGDDDASSGDDGTTAPTEAPSGTTAGVDTTGVDTTVGATTTAAADATTAPGSDTTAAGREVDKTGWPEKLTLAAVPSEEATQLEASYDPLIQVLEEDLGLDVEFFQATAYAGIIEAQIAGEVDVAQYGPFSYVLARTNGAAVEPIGALVGEKGEEPGYQSYGITRGDNDEINELADFKGKKVCFVDPGSTSGFLYPSAGLLELGIDPEKDVESTMAGGHDASAIAVADGSCDAGFAFDTMVDTELIEAGDIAEGDLKVVWKSEVIAGSPIAINTELPESLQAEISRIVLEEANVDGFVERGICTSADDCGVTDEDSWGWVAVEDSFYDGVRAVCEATAAEPCTEG